MIPKDLKEMIEIAGGKVIVSEGDIEKSYVVMKLSDYLAEKRKEATEKKEIKRQELNRKKEEIKNQLTDENNLDKIGAELDELYQKERVKELEELLKAEKDEYSYESL